MEAFFKPGLAVAPYIRSDTNPNAHADIAHLISCLQKHYPSHFPPEAPHGWDTRLPLDLWAISTEVFYSAFPGGVDIVLDSPPMHTVFLAHIVSHDNPDKRISRSYYESFIT